MGKIATRQKAKRRKADALSCHLTMMFGMTAHSAVKRARPVTIIGASRIGRTPQPFSSMREEENLSSVTPVEATAARGGWPSSVATRAVTDTP